MVISINIFRKPLRIFDFVKTEQVHKDSDVIHKRIELYPSANLLLSVIQKENEYEAERSRGLENRTGIFLAFAGALLIFLSSNFDISEFKMVEVDSLNDAYPLVLIIILFIVTWIALITSIIYFIRVISTQENFRLETKEFTKENAKDQKTTIAAELMIDYGEIIRHNNKNNDKKVVLYKKGIYLIMIAVIMTSFMYGFNIFI